MISNQKHYNIYHMKKLTNISRDHDNRNFLEKGTPEDIPNHKLDNTLVNENIFESFHKYVLEFKGNCNNDTVIKILSSKDDILNLILISFKKSKEIEEHVPLESYHSYVADNNVELKFKI